MRRALYLLLPALCAAACGGGADESEPQAASYEAVNTEVFAPRCTAACHSGGPDIAAGGLDLNDDPHAVLLGKPATASACKGMGLRRVVPGDPDSSLLYLKIVSKIEGTEPPCGDGMPSGVGIEPLTTEEADLVRAWIVEAGKKGGPAE